MNSESQSSPSSPPSAGSVPAADNPVSDPLTRLVLRSQNIMAHAWMIRTFIKHSDEVEDFPELNEMARTIFDVFRAVETQVNDPVAYFRTVRKKVGKLRSAADQFKKDAWHASTHTNFQQAAIASKFLGEQLQELLEQAERLIPRPVAPKFALPGKAPLAAEQSEADDATDSDSQIVDHA
jgi:hypothetical protein